MLRAADVRVRGGGGGDGGLHPPLRGQPRLVRARPAGPRHPHQAARPHAGPHPRRVSPRQGSLTLFLDI